MQQDEFSYHFEVLDAVELAVIVLEVGDDGLPRYIAMNTKSREFTKLEHKDYAGKTALELYGGATGRRALNQHLAVISSGKEATYDIVLPTQHKEKYLSTTLRPVFNADGRLVYLVGSSSDITSERERDEALELTRMALDKAEEASQAKERFLANMSHEIRTPMNGIIGMCELLQETDLDEQQRLFADTILNSATALLGVINDVLDFSKIQADKISLHDAPFSLQDLVQDVGTLLWARAAYKGIDLRTDYPADAPHEFTGDASKIRQILMNLLGNAIKFTEDGHVAVSVSYDPGAAALPLRIQVSDTGIGIEPSQLKWIFSAFEQVDRRSARVIEGTGLGLAITQALVERMGGTITASSVPGQGSVFTVALDLKQPDHHLPRPTDDAAAVFRDHRQALNLQPSQPVPELPPGALAGKRILVAEDNRTNQLLVRKMLKSTGAELRFAENGRIALEAYKSEGCNLILMDLSMPVMGGLEAARRIRAHERSAGLPECPIVALTANAQPSDVEACLAAGMNDFLSKPFRKNELQARILRQGG
ncbi:ATP-binding protein [Leisingera sp. McT4-56]|uniref:ATP-binding protein n=1 Tax=Leisingera sp. McT4-56 TaxID=2881255 RepID=UPI001CF8B219|nr:ATP-binding protein [Leisingera sp. McT4-56]MCB4454621.1 response regulator [Leisingera sp. McT4-56]